MRGRSHRENLIQSPLARPAPSSRSVMTDSAPSTFTFREDERFRAHERGASLDHHQAARTTTARPVLPIPDLRFEYSYLRSIRPFVKLLRTAALPSKVTKTHGGGEDSKNIEKEVPWNGEQATFPKSETLEIQWKRVIWVTARDQFMAPFLQGALWYVSLYRLLTLSDSRKLGLWQASISHRGVQMLGRRWARTFARESPRAVVPPGSEDLHDNWVFQPTVYHPSGKI